MRKTIVVLSLMLSMVFQTQRVSATENGLLSTPVGVNTVVNGILPAPGDTQFYEYTLHYEADKFVGNDGKSLVPDFKIRADVIAPRVVHTWEQQLGPFTLASGIIAPLVKLSINTPSGSGKNSGLGDIILQPLFIGGSNSSKTFFAFLAPFDVAIPTGSYNKNRVDNLGNNYFAFIPSLNTTWFPTPDWDVSTTTLIEMNTKNRDTNYHSGSVATFEYNVSYQVIPNLHVGVQGFFMKQFTDDKLDGDTFQDGFRGKAAGFGPQIRYMFNQRAGMLLKYQKEFDVRNRAEGNKLWFEFTLPL